MATTARMMLLRLMGVRLRAAAALRQFLDLTVPDQPWGSICFSYPVLVLIFGFRSHTKEGLCLLDILN
jgi:hypothetical protein